MSNQNEFLANYARSLSNALIKHSTPDEKQYLINLFKQEGQRICCNRKAPGLHESHYRLYCQFELGSK